MQGVPTRLSVGSGSPEGRPASPRLPPRILPSLALAAPPGPPWPRPPWPLPCLSPTRRIEPVYHVLLASVPISSLRQLCLRRAGPASGSPSPLPGLQAAAAHASVSLVLSPPITSLLLVFLVQNCLALADLPSPSEDRHPEDRHPLCWHTRLLSWVSASPRLFSVLAQDAPEWTVTQKALVRLSVIRTWGSGLHGLPAPSAQVEGSSEHSASLPSTGSLGPSANSCGRKLVKNQCGSVVR